MNATKHLNTEPMDREEPPLRPLPEPVRKAATRCVHRHATNPTDAHKILVTLGLEGTP